MSYTTIKAVWPGERHANIAELKNSYGGAAMIWATMCEKYLHLRRGGWLTNCDKLWPLWERKDIPKHQRAVLTMTYDNVIISKHDYARAAADIRAFLRDFPQDPAIANHWPAIAELFENDPEYPAIGFHWTSVNCDPFEGPYNEETEENDSMDWTLLWDMYSKLDEIG